MKYIKYYENENEDFNIGDYVILDLKYAKGFYVDEDFYSTNVGTVIGFNESKLTIRYISGIEREIYSMLLRKVNKQELEEYKLKNNINKYNL